VSVKLFVTVNFTGCSNENNPLGKILSPQLLHIFTKKCTLFTEEDSGHICSKFRYIIWSNEEITTIWT